MFSKGPNQNQNKTQNVRPFKEIEWNLLYLMRQMHNFDQ